MPASPHRSWSVLMPIFSNARGYWYCTGHAAQSCWQSAPSTAGSTSGKSVSGVGAGAEAEAEAGAGVAAQSVGGGGGGGGGGVPGREEGEEREDVTIVRVRSRRLRRLVMMAGLAWLACWLASLVWF